MAADARGQFANCWADTSSCVHQEAELQQRRRCCKKSPARRQVLLRAGNMTHTAGWRTLGRPLPSMSTKSGCAAARLRQAPYIASMLAASPPTSSTTYASTTHLHAWRAAA